MADYWTTCATLAPVLLIGLALQPPFRKRPRTKQIAAARQMYMALPPLAVILICLNVLAGFAPGDVDWLKRLVMLLLALHLGGAVVGLAYGDGSNRNLLVHRPDDESGES